MFKFPKFGSEQALNSDFTAFLSCVQAYIIKKGVSKVDFKKLEFISIW
jgi:hypothetical protein